MKTNRKGNIMKKLVEVQEVEDEGLISLLGEVVEICCCRYIYHGKLVGINDIDIKIENASIIYDTGDHEKSNYADIQSLNRDVYIMLGAIEHYMKARQ